MAGPQELNSAEAGASGRFALVVTVREGHQLALPLETLTDSAEAVAAAAAVADLEAPGSLAPGAVAMRVVDRAVEEGDLVQRSTDEEGTGRPFGMVMRLEQLLDVERCATGARLLGVPHGRLAPVCGLHDEDWVVLDEDVGGMESKWERVTVAFPDGGVCIVNSNAATELRSDDDRDSELEPGMNVRAPRRVWREAKWVRGSCSSRTRVGTVVSMRAEEVEVVWGSGPALREQSTLIPAAAGRLLAYPRRSDFGAWQLNRPALLFATDDTPVAPARDGGAAAAGAVAESPVDKEVAAIEAAAAAAEAEVAARRAASTASRPAAAAAAASSAPVAAARAAAHFGAGATPPGRVTPVGVGEPTPLSSLLAAESCAGALGNLPKTVTTGLCASDVEVAGPSMDPKFLETSGITVESLGPGAGLMEDPSISAHATAGGNVGGVGGIGGGGENNEDEEDEEDDDEEDEDEEGDSDSDSSSHLSMSITGRMSMWATPPTMGRRPPQGVEDDRWRLVTVQRTKTFAEVQWQDGTVTREEAIHLNPCHDYMPSEFLPGQFVVEAASLAETAAPAKCEAPEAATAAATSLPAAADGVPGEKGAAAAEAAPAEGVSVAGRAAALAASADECAAWLRRYGEGKATPADDTANLAPVAGVPAGVVKAILAVSGTVPAAGSMIQQLFSLRLHTCSTSGAPSISLWVGPTSDLVPLPTVFRLMELGAGYYGEGDEYSQHNEDESESESDDDDEEDEEEEEEYDEAEEEDEEEEVQQVGATANSVPIAGPGSTGGHSLSDEEEWVPPPHHQAIRDLPDLITLPHPDHPDPVPNLSVLPPAMRSVARSASALQTLWTLDTKAARAALVNGLVSALERLSARLRAAADTANVPPRIGLVLACDRKGKMACVHWLPGRQAGAAAEGSLAPPSPEALRRCIDTMGIGKMLSGLFHDAVARTPTDGSKSSTNCEWVPVFDIREFALLSPRATDIVMGAPGAKLTVTQAALGSPATPHTASVQAAIGAAPPVAPGAAPPVAPGAGPPPFAGALAQQPPSTLLGAGTGGAPLTATVGPPTVFPVAGAWARHRLGGMQHASLPQCPFSPLEPGSPFAVCAGVVYAVLPSGHVLIRWPDLSFSAEHPLDIVSLVADQDGEMSHSMDGASSFDIIFASPLTKEQEEAAAAAPAVGAGAGAAPSSQLPDAAGVAGTQAATEPSDASAPAAEASSLVEPAAEPSDAPAAASPAAAAPEGNAAVDGGFATAAEPVSAAEPAAEATATGAPPTDAAAAGSTAGAASEASSEEPTRGAAARAAAPSASHEEVGSALARAVSEDDWTAAVKAAWSTWGFSGMVTEPGPAPADFVRSGASGCAAGSAGPAARPGASLLRRLMGEARSLSAGLPPGSALFRFEDDPLALRLVLAGFPNTPYMHGMFVFDIVLPETYPAKPPHVHFQCRIGQRLNPNLYAEGKVCLSLLGTWEGEAASEAWQPGTSTLLQLVVSLQAFVLNRPDPYFNEPGTEELRGAPDTDKRAKDYNENAHLLSLRAARLQLVNPPAGGAGRLCALHMTSIAPRVAAMQVALQASRTVSASTASTGGSASAASPGVGARASSGAGAPEGAPAGTEAAAAAEATAAAATAPSTVGDAGAADAACLAKLLPSPPSAGFFAVLRREAAALVAAVEARAAAAASAAAEAEQA